jgi:hypothetical protein
MFGKLFRFSVDALAISTIVAGVKKTTGFRYVPPRAKRGVDFLDINDGADSRIAPRRT